MPASHEACRGACIPDPSCRRQRATQMNLGWRYSLAARTGDQLLERRILNVVATPVEDTIRQRGGCSPGKASQPRTLALEPLGLGRLIAGQVVHPRISHRVRKMIPLGPKLVATKSTVEVRALFGKAGKILPNGWVVDVSHDFHGVGPRRGARRPKSSGRSRSIIPL